MMDYEAIGDLLDGYLIASSEKDSNGIKGANPVDGLFAIARSLENVARAIRLLGNADAATPMGAIEALGAVMKDGLEGVASAISDHTAMIQE